LQQEINALDAQEDHRYGKGKLGIELPDELRRRQERLARIRQARKEMESATASAAARQRQEEAEEARAKAAAAEESDAAAEEQAVLTRKEEAAAAKAKAAREKANEAAEDAGMEPPDLEPLPCHAMPRRGLARKVDGTPTRKTQRNFTDADSHL
jgi:septal ring factor EnvC (AmiA/AmiB activator)